MSAGALVALVAALVVQAGYTVASERAAADDGLEAKARALGGLMEDVAGPSIAFDDDKAVAEGLGYVASDSDFAFSAAIRADGRVIAFRGNSIDRSSIEGSLRSVATAEVLSLDDLVVAATPVVTDGKQVGTVFVGLRSDDAHARVMHRSAWAAVISIIGIAIAVIVVQVLARKIVQRSREMRVVLDNVDEGLATVRLDGSLERECSAAFERWFGAPGNGTFFAQIAGDDTRTRDMLALGWQDLVDGVMPLEVLVEQFPSRLDRDGKHFRIDIKPLLHRDSLAGALLRIRDVTTEVEAQRTLAAQREYVAVFERALRDPHGVREIVEDTGRLVAQLPAIVDPTERARAVHTIKGNAAVYGVHSVAEVAHRLEDLMMSDDTLDPVVMQELSAAWTAFASRVEELVGTARDRVEVSRGELEGLVELAGHGGTALVERLRALMLEPVAVRLDTMRRQIARVAEVVGKPVPEVVVDAAGVRLAADRLRPFWLAFSHLVRNAVDHGLESPDARVAAGKPAAGRIELRARVDHGAVSIEIADDGSGIAWDRVRARAAAAGLPADSHGDLERALFGDGVSTADGASQTSGRGVGLAAVRAAVRELDGQIAVTSEPGRGTRFSFSFPVSSRPRSLARSSSGPIVSPQELV
jgi:two-component system chemotaxis sensor kinase CheA